MSMTPICCIKIVKSLLSVRVFGKITKKSKSDFDLLTLTPNKFCKWLNLFHRILKSIFFVTSVVKILWIFKSLPAPTVKRKLVVAIFFVYSIININSPFDSLDEAPWEMDLPALRCSCGGHCPNWNLDSKDCSPSYSSAAAAAGAATRGSPSPW